MAKVKHVKLSKVANSFYDPSTGLKLSPGKMHTLSEAESKSPKVKKAIKGGHIEYADDEEFEAYQKGLEVVESEDLTNKETEDDSDDNELHTEESLSSKTKEGLINILLALNAEQDEEDQLSEQDIKRMNKSELTESILEFQENEEE